MAATGHLLSIRSWLWFPGAQLHALIRLQLNKPESFPVCSVLTDARRCIYSLAEFRAGCSHCHFTSIRYRICRVRPLTWLIRFICHCPQTVAGLQKLGENPKVPIELFRLLPISTEAQIRAETGGSESSPAGTAVRWCVGTGSRAPRPLSCPLHVFAPCPNPICQGRNQRRQWSPSRLSQPMDRRINTFTHTVDRHGPIPTLMLTHDVSMRQPCKYWWCSGSAETHARMWSAKPQLAIKIIEGENRIREERLTVSDVDSCFNSSHTTVCCSSVIIRNKRTKIHTSTLQKHEISKMCQDIKDFPLWFHEVKYEAAALVDIILEWNNKKHNTYRGFVLFLSPRSVALWPSSWTVASCHLSHLSCLSSLWRKQQKVNFEAKHF